METINFIKDSLEKTLERHGLDVSENSAIMPAILGALHLAYKRGRHEAHDAIMEK